LLGKRIPLGLKVFLTAFAIVDDLGAVAVIAVFYSHGMQLSPLLGALAILAFLGFLSWRGYYNKYFYFMGAIGVWLLFFRGGLHPTLAGVLMAFTIPIQRSINLSQFLQNMDDAVDTLRNLSPAGKNKLLVSKKQLDALDDIDVHVELVVSPLQHLEHKLHGYVGYLIMPLFALANAGVPLGLGDGTHTGLILALAASMVLGKFLGIVLFSMVAVRLGWCTLPEGMGTRHLVGVGLLGGLGFTMALFIAGLAYPDLGVLAASKLGILLGSAMAGLAGYAVLRGAKAPELARSSAHPAARSLG
jgi:NhaA family Na+:H+ antiporter